MSSKSTPSTCVNVWEGRGCMAIDTHTHTYVPTPCPCVCGCSLCVGKKQPAADQRRPPH